MDKMKLTQAIAFFSYGFSSHSYLPRRFRLCKIGCVFFKIEASTDHCSVRRSKRIKSIVKRCIFPSKVTLV
jgi:hypothetical protein